MTPTEKRRIDSIIARMGANPTLLPPPFKVDVGVKELDDCATLSFGGDFDIVMGSDFVRGEGFKLFQKGYLSRFDIGYYVVGANVSDLAAMGATPLGITIVFRYTNATSDSAFDEVMAGVVHACSSFSIPLLGGDSGQYECPVLSGAAIGFCPTGRALLRSAARPGDKVFLTGSVGTAGAAFQYFDKAGGDSNRELEESLLRPWRKVAPAVSQGVALVNSREVQCAMDTSDGLKTTCKQIANASAIDIRLFRDRIPVGDGVEEVATILGVDPVLLACGDSVDFRLVFTVRSEAAQEIGNLFSANGWELYEIGECSSPSERPTVWLVSGERCEELPGLEKSA